MPNHMSNKNAPTERFKLIIREVKMQNICVLTCIDLTGGSSDNAFSQNQKYFKCLEIPKKKYNVKNCFNKTTY